MNQTIDREPAARETVQFFAGVNNLSRLRDDADWCENRCRYLAWEANRRRRRLKNAAGLLLSAAAVGVAYWFRLGG